MYGIILLYSSGSSWDGTRQHHYRAVRCDDRYRYVAPEYETLEESRAAAAELSASGQQFELPRWEARRD